MRLHDSTGFAASFVLTVASLIVVAASTTTMADELPRVAVATDQKSFVLQPGGKPFVPWGFNYDHDDRGRLIEDYWDAEWPTIAEDFREMRELGANTVRIHLQLGRFMTAADTPNLKSLAQLSKLVRLAEENRLYLDLTGLACYHKQDVPAWYDKLDEQQRWNVQAQFWSAIAERCAKSPAIFCYDLMNEPVVPGGKRTDGDWLGPSFAGKHFVQFITLDSARRDRPDIAKAWVDHLVAAVRKHDRHHLITVGLVDWSLDRPGLTSGFVPDKIAASLDFLSVHIYPEKNKIGFALDTLRGFAIGKPVLIEETFPLKCSLTEFTLFHERSKQHAAGWIGFYWGKNLSQLRPAKSIADALMAGWLEWFQKNSPKP
jgi:hypothetical protein